MKERERERQGQKERQKQGEKKTEGERDRKAGKEIRNDNILEQKLLCVQ